MKYNIGSIVNPSATIAGTAGSAIEVGAFLAAKFDAQGKIVVAGKGENALGILIAEMDGVKEGDSVAVQVKEMSKWRAGAAVNAGDELTSDANGKCVKAQSGDFITAVALTTAEAAEQVIEIQICKSGYAK